MTKESVSHVLLILQRYRTPSRSRSRSATPIHWKEAQYRTIKLSDYEVSINRKCMKEYMCIHKLLKSTGQQIKLYPNFSFLIKGDLTSDLCSLGMG